MRVAAIARDPSPDGDGLSSWTLDLLVGEVSLRGVAKVAP
jgi:hypothetical protein